MQAESAGPYLTARDASRIQTFCAIAKMKNATISLSELLALTSLDMNEVELAEAWKRSKVLNEKYTITNYGLVNEKTGTDLEIQRERLERAERASSNISWAAKFSDFLNDNYLRALAISGSTSYLSVSENDDLDLFYVAKKDTMWIGFTRALLRARLFRLKERNSPWICLSYVSDESFLDREIANNRNPIIARDALSAKVVRGDSYFDELLQRNKWMAEFFPKMYEQRIKQHYSDHTREFQNYNRFVRASTKLVNVLLFYCVGTYIRLKSGLLNRKLIKMGNDSAVFKLRIGKDHCIYESKLYKDMKGIYSELNQN